MSRFLGEETDELFGASFHVHPQPREAAEKIMDLLVRRRRSLGIDKKAERKLMDMKDRREIRV